MLQLHFIQTDDIFMDKTKLISPICKQSNSLTSEGNTKKLIVAFKCQCIVITVKYYTDSFTNLKIDKRNVMFSSSPHSHKHIKGDLLKAITKGISIGT